MKKTPNPIAIWVQAARLRTLPLSISGIFLGGFLAKYYHVFEGMVFFWAILTTVFLQILSNFANDYGDGIKGTDQERTGEKRAVASGEISAQAMKRAVIAMSILSLISIIATLLSAFYPNDLSYLYLFIGFGLLCILAAIFYTVGNAAYGYKGLGDVFVFLFFGVLSVSGSLFLFSKTFFITSLLPASAVGLLSVAVLNLNNMRDIHTDKKANKNTLVVRMGFSKAKIYHSSLLLLPYFLASGYLASQQKLAQFESWLFLLTLPVALLLLRKVYRTQNAAELDTELKKTAFLCLFFSLLFGLGLMF